VRKQVAEVDRRLFLQTVTFRKSILHSSSICASMFASTREVGGVSKKSDPLVGITHGVAGVPGKRENVS
jgi:hypothetical protein